MVSNESRDNNYITWARCGVASLARATHCPCSKLSGVWMVKG